MLSAEEYQFGPFTLDGPEQRLTRQGQSIRLKPKTFEVLLVLIRNAGRLVKKNDLLQTVWPEAFVEEGILAAHVSALRKILDTNGAESLAGLRLRTGDGARAEDSLARLRALGGDGSPIGWCVFHLACGEVEEAAGYLAQAIEQRHPRAIVLLTGPGRRFFESSKQWARLAKLMKLAQ